MSKGFYFKISGLVSLLVYEVKLVHFVSRINFQFDLASLVMIGISN